MNILAVESSCDETAVAIVRDGREVLCDCIASQVDLHRIYGGVVPEIASRKHIEAIYGLADQALQQANMTRDEIDAVAVVRRDANAEIKDLQKNKEISEDEQRSAEEKIQKATDSSIKKADDLLAAKQKELMEI